MAIIKREKRTHGYVVISNEIFNHPNISWAAKGLLGYLLSKADNWELLVNDIWSNFPGGRDAVYKMINELKAAGYVEPFTDREANGRIGDRGYIVREVPVSIDSKLVTGNPEQAKVLDLEYQDQARQVLHPVIQDKAISLDPEKPDQAVQDTYKINNIKNKYFKKTAAISTVPSSKRVDEPEKTTKNLAAASFSQSQQLSSDDLSIGAELTALQMAILKARLTTVVLPDGYSIDRLMNEITFTLLNPKAFTEAGQSFEKKLNTLLKRVRQGLWAVPQEKVVQAQKEEQRQASLEHHERAQLMAAVNHAKRMLDYCQNTSNPLIREQFLKDLELAKAALAEFDKARSKSRPSEALTGSKNGFAKEQPYYCHI